MDHADVYNIFEEGHEGVQKKWSPMGWPLSKFYRRARTDVEFEDQRWPYKWARDDRATAYNMAPVYASLCWSQQCHAIANMGQLQHW